MEQNLEAAGKSSVEKKPQTTKNFTTLVNQTEAVQWAGYCSWLLWAARCRYRALDLDCSESGVTPLKWIKNSERAETDPYWDCLNLHRSFFLDLFAFSLCFLYSETPQPDQNYSIFQKPSVYVSCKNLPDFQMKILLVLVPDILNVFDIIY